MLKKIFICLLFLTIVAASPFIPVSWADNTKHEHHDKVEGPDEDDCDGGCIIPLPGGPTCSQAELDAATCVVLGKYTIRAAVDANGKFPVSCDGANNCFKYTIDPPIKPYCNKKIAEVLVPACGSQNIISITGGAPTPIVSAPGVGSSLTKWALGIVQDKVVSFVTPTATTIGSFWMVTDTPQAGVTSIAFKDGPIRNFGAIVGPDCAISPGYIIQNTTETKKIADYDAVIERDQTTGCISSLKYYDPLLESWVVVPAEPVNLGDHTLVTCGMLDGNQKCQECAALFHSTKCTTLTSGGRTYKIPTGCI